MIAFYLFAWLYLVLLVSATNIGKSHQQENHDTANYSRTAADNAAVLGENDNDLRSPKTRIRRPKIQSLRSMLLDMFQILTSPDMKDLKTKEGSIVEEFMNLYQPQYQKEVDDFLRMMNTYSKPQFTHPIFNGQRVIIPILLDMIHTSK